MNNYAKFLGFMKNESNLKEEFDDEMIDYDEEYKIEFETFE